jgi:hypothetical protein
MELRKQAEAAEKMGESGAKTAKKKRVTRKKTTKKKRTKEKVAERRRLVWGVFSGSMKEEARFPYDQLSEAEDRVEKLRAKSKKLYFIQPIKEPIPEDEKSETAAEE